MRESRCHLGSRRSLSRLGVDRIGHRKGPQFSCGGWSHAVLTRPRRNSSQHCASRKTVDRTRRGIYFDQSTLKIWGYVKCEEPYTTILSSRTRPNMVRYATLQLHHGSTRSYYHHGHFMVPYTSYRTSLQQPPTIRPTDMSVGRYGACHINARTGQSNHWCSSEHVRTLFETRRDRNWNARKRVRPQLSPKGSKHLVLEAQTPQTAHSCVVALLGRYCHADGRTNLGPNDVIKVLRQKASEENANIYQVSSGDDVRNIIDILD